jgi:hypothetical protein
MHFLIVILGGLLIMMGQHSRSEARTPGAPHRLVWAAACSLAVKGEENFPAMM